MIKYWTIDKCREEASKYKRKIDFLKGNKRAYDASYKHGWLDEICKHMEFSGDKFNRCIYSYEFSDNSVYVGLTCNLNLRDKQHKSNKDTNTSSVLRKIKSTGLIPNLVKLTDYVDYREAIKLEKYYAEKYKNDGWFLLNVAKTGSLGVSNLIYTKDKCEEVIKNCIYLSDLYKNHSRVIQICKNNGWFINEIESLIKHNRGYKYWNKENCTEIALQFSNLKDFYKNYRQVYNSSKRNGWLEEITSHMSKNERKIGKIYWTKDKCYEESKKYSKRYLFQIGSRGAYKAAYRNNWLDEFFN